MSSISGHPFGESRHATPTPTFQAGERVSVPPDGPTSPAFIIVDPRFPERADPKPFTRTYKNIKQHQKQTYTVWRENGAQALAAAIRAKRIGPRVDGAQPGDLYEINYGESPALWAMHSDEWCSISISDQHPVLGQYVLHYRLDGTGPSWVLRETLQKYERKSGGK
ncbi:hypothetical protein SISNIDRAFT_488163 [Sistotremastrum niveocremeum HHB9708]|uniref:Uncharacterized protein n=1 Tax=Sistotremastrum niveocremeum HHB9708 TaxID=1314777 RepID=A0A164RIJ6_9AGAM|nr:hypothetical protein SISNIDRAFT_488163 [Sistotremastrum niveocremeum HHB9708]